MNEDIKFSVDGKMNWTKDLPCRQTNLSLIKHVHNLIRTDINIIEHAKLFVVGGKLVNDVSSLCIPAERYSKIRLLDVESLESVTTMLNTTTGDDLPHQIFIVGLNVTADEFTIFNLIHNRYPQLSIWLSVIEDGSTKE
jgi:hypothetical protein